MEFIDHPKAIGTTHFPVRSYIVGPYYFLAAVPRDAPVDDSEPAWWVSKNHVWLREQPFDTLEEAMRYAARPSAD